MAVAMAARETTPLRDPLERAERRWAAKIAVLYGALVGFWIFIQSGLPLRALFGFELERIGFLQTLNAWFFVLASAWLLYLLVGRHIASIREAETALRLRDRAIESSVNAILITENRGADNPIVYVNPAFERITGYPRADVLGKDPRFLYGEDRDQKGLEEIRAATREARAGHAVLRNYRADGTVFWNDLHIAPVRDGEGRVTHYVGIQNDVTEARTYLDVLAYQENYDTLTRLPNRTLLQDRIGQAITHAERYQTIVAVAIVNVDNFKLINDSLGYQAGDALLKLLAARIQSRVRSLDTVARLGADEFAITSFEHNNARAASSEVRGVLDAVGRPFVINEREVFITCCAGVAFYPQDGQDTESLLKCAHSALHRAKAQGRNVLHFYAPEMDARMNERFQLENKLRRAVDNRELRLHYQPQVDLRTGRVMGAEALIRWPHPELGMISPARFIPLAEETGLIVPIGEWTMRTACMDNRSWQAAGLPPVVIGVNVSAHQFSRGDLVSVVERVLKDTGLDPRFLELELTESVIMENANEVLLTLLRLRKMGVQLAIDDFGTGYSSLSYLRRFPIQRVKIDQSFIKDITSNPDDAAIAKAVISLGHSLRLEVIAEGVESKEQVAFLRAADCDQKQGYYFSRPVPAADFERLLREGRRLVFDEGPAAGVLEGL